MEENRAQQPLETELACSEETLLQHTRRQLLLLIRKQVVADVLDAPSACILSLRMGLTDGVCYSLKEVGKRVHLSPEAIRRRQYLGLRQCVRQSSFLQLLNEYAHMVKLPRGVTYYLSRSGDFDSQLLS